MGGGSNSDVFLGSGLLKSCMDKLCIFAGLFFNFWLAVFCIPVAKLDDVPHTEVTPGISSSLWPNPGSPTEIRNQLERTLPVSKLTPL